ncbi:MAG TPA: WGxxGxxG family protein [Halomicronema sp.]
MNRSSIRNLIGASVVAASLAVLPATLPASAQTNTPSGTDTTTTSPNYRTDDVRTTDTTRDNDFDWGWLGLLGLLGLAGLARRKEPARYTTERDPDVVRSDYR